MSEILIESQRESLYIYRWGMSLIRSGNEYFEKWIVKGDFSICLLERRTEYFDRYRENIVSISSILITSNTTETLHWALNRKNKLYFNFRSNDVVHYSYSDHPLCHSSPWQLKKYFIINDKTEFNIFQNRYWKIQVI